MLSATFPLKIKGSSGMRPSDSRQSEVRRFLEEALEISNKRAYRLTQRLFDYHSSEEIMIRVTESQLGRFVALRVHYSLVQTVEYPSIRDVMLPSDALPPYEDMRPGFRVIP